jgi:DNA/RNA-binding domain of Phe-tRNA-synthetase-like protein
MKYIITKEIFDKYPDLRIGVVVGKNLEIANSHIDLEVIKNDNVGKFRCYMKGKDILNEPNIEAWRETYRSFGVKPKKHQPTTESLLRRIIKGDSLPIINTSVDAYLAVELLYLLPIGGYDLSRIDGDILLRFSQGGDIFHPIGSIDEEITENGEVIYTDCSRVLTRRWNYRDSDYSKITTKTNNIILACEATYNTIKTEDVTNTISKIIEYESEFCGGQYESFFLDINTPIVEFYY